ncbi:mechanosensitive ion channel family protein [Herbiconiux sp. YIM B11900]|uniref:mechanosensitive ion channel family protein n=1 Tax=Herbiconiux sp. YIM B11900 TaxID=3404131 RepID=UPI003F855E46
MSFMTDYRVPLSILIIIIAAFVIRGILLYAVRRLVDQVVSGVKKKQNVTDTQALVASPLAAVRIVQRTRTIGSVLKNVINVTVVIITIVLLVNTIDPTIIGSLALLTAALGAGLGFGAQNIVKDVLNGLFMVFEDQLGVGDVVDLGPATGVVEAVGIRITQVRDVNGTLWFVRNGEILRVGNMSQGWARVIIDLAIPYDSDIDVVQERVLDAAVAMAAEPKWRSRIIERPEIWGLESISAEALVIRLVVKTRTSAKDDVARDLRMRLKRTLDEIDVTLPSLNTVVLSGFEGATSVKGARPPRTKPIATQDADPAPPRKSPRKPSATTAPTNE